ncbi:MAG: ATP-dependent DNA helicase RecG [Rhizobiales bacterium]|nr:ATP-dependent DNA helicase RecG [Hyphomicrobiales bacterium]
MRPEALDPLFASVQSLEGVGPKIAGLLKRALALPPGVEQARVVDLFWHLPTGLVDRRAQPAVASAVPGAIATLRLRVLKHQAPPRNSRAPYRVQCEDDSGRLDLVFFRADRTYVERLLPVGSERIVSGRIEAYGDKLQMPHPDYAVAPENAASLPLLEPVYPLTAGLVGRSVARAIGQALTRLPAIAEWLEQGLREREGWPSFAEALHRIHVPREVGDISNVGPNWQRLAFDELLANQLALAVVRESLRAQRGRAISGDGRLRGRIEAALPFRLTGSQRQALAEIYDDIGAPRRMLRLIQGDVGSGKTVVALLAMATVIEAGAQAALMAPTEVLARQHAETIAPLAEASGLTLGLLTGREKGKPRRELLARLESGEIDILIGTHALFQPDVVFRDLALAVIDEQHRFGVHQRLALQSKGGGYGADALVMTATPIPRTLLMTHYGDLDVSRLTEKPAGRKPVKTVAVPIERLEEVIAGLGRALAEGAQVYWVCPLVEGSDASELASAEERHAHLRQHFGDRVGLVHGQMAASAKDAAMAAFAGNQTQVLVSTTVVEVGVNVPNATIMVIEHAERFGLAQLHQLRGRVGRGDRQSFCTLLYAQPLSENAKLRLKTMCETEDGFVIAEEDLRLRGGGEVLGTRQSGTPEFRVARTANFEELLSMARDDARLILARDPKLESERGRALRTLLYLFECDEAIRLFRAG